jgi:hypothetical protein
MQPSGPFRLSLTSRIRGRDRPELALSLSIKPLSTAFVTSPLPARDEVTKLKLMVCTMYMYLQAYFSNNEPS